MDLISGISCPLGRVKLSKSAVFGLAFSSSLIVPLSTISSLSGVVTFVSTISFLIVMTAGKFLGPTFEVQLPWSFARSPLGSSAKMEMAELDRTIRRARLVNGLIGGGSMNDL